MKTTKVITVFAADANVRHIVVHIIMLTVNLKKTERKTQHWTTNTGTLGAEKNTTVSQSTKSRNVQQFKYNSFKIIQNTPCAKKWTTN